MRTLVPLSTVVVDDLDDVTTPSKGDLVTLASDGRLRVWDDKGREKPGSELRTETIKVPYNGPTE